LANDFSNPFDSLIDGPDFQLNTDDFVSKYIIAFALFFLFPISYSVAQ
jgi:hypothetical protein